MREVKVYNQVTLDGFFSTEDGDTTWAHKSDPEWDEFTVDNARGGGVLMFGRKTYDMMASFWPMPAAAQMAPELAERMNSLPKVVFSRTLERSPWNNTRIVHTDPVAEVRRLKAESGPDIVVMGSGTIVSQLATAGLIDRLQLVVNPIVLGKGRSMFDGVDEKLDWKLLESRRFENGNTVQTYAKG